MTITNEPVTTGQPAPPRPRHRPVEIAPDTFVIQATQGEGVAPVAVHLNAMVIRGPEPIVVDTGAPSTRDEYLEDLWSLVDPDDVRWVFLSHDDEDHYGNLDAVMAACPRAVLLTSWFQWERLGAGLGISTIASAHSPTIHRDLVPAAMDMLRRLPEVAPIPTPDQAMLDQIVAAAGAQP